MYTVYGGWTRPAARCRRRYDQYRDGPLQLYENGWFILKNSVAHPGT
eukprot:SAG31_NODE_1698_length_7500_cov_3.644778_8_plen_46_part_01